MHVLFNPPRLRAQLFIFKIGNPTAPRHRILRNSDFSRFSTHISHTKTEYLFLVFIIMFTKQPDASEPPRKRSKHKLPHIKRPPKHLKTLLPGPPELDTLLTKRWNALVQSVGQKQVDAVAEALKRETVGETEFLLYELAESVGQEQAETVAETLKRESVGEIEFLLYDTSTTDPMKMAMENCCGRIIDALIPVIQQDQPGVPFDPYSYRGMGLTELEIATVCGDVDRVSKILDNWMYGPLTCTFVVRQAGKAGRVSVMQYVIRKCRSDPHIRSSVAEIWKSMVQNTAFGGYVDILAWLFRVGASMLEGRPDDALQKREAVRGCLIRGRGDCLWWILRQPMIFPEVAPGGGACIDILWRLYAMTTPPDERGLPTTLDLSNRLLGDTICKLIGNVMILQEREFFNCIDLSKNPRITDAGIRVLCYGFKRAPLPFQRLHLSDLPVRLVNLLRKLDVTRVFNDTVTFYPRTFVKRVWWLPDNAGDHLYDKPTSESGAPPTRVSCPFPTLVTIVSCWIADQIRNNSQT